MRSYVNGSVEVDQSSAFTPGKNDVFTVELDYDYTNSQMEFRLIDGGTTQTTETQAVTGMSNYDIHYAIMSDGSSVSFPGSMSMEFRNPSFSTLGV